MAAEKKKSIVDSVYELNGALWTLYDAYRHKVDMETPLQNVFKLFPKTMDAVNIIVARDAKAKQNMAKKEKHLQHVQMEVKRMTKITDPTGVVNMYFLLKNYLEGKETDASLREKADVILQRVKKEVIDDPEGETPMPEPILQPLLGTGTWTDAVQEVRREIR